MKHVREPMPDVQVRRPEMSAALAAVVDHATAKEHRQPLRDRRRDGPRPRAGARDRGRPHRRDHAARRRPSCARCPATRPTSRPPRAAPPAPGARRRPARARDRRGGRLSSSPTRTEKGPGPRGDPDAAGSDRRRPRLAAPPSDYDPEGDGKESREATQFAIDGNPPDELGHRDLPGRFRGQQQGRRRPLRRRRHPGRRQGAGPRHLHARLQGDRLRGQHRARPPRRLDEGQPDREVAEDQIFKLRTDGRRYRYYLLWISSLPEDNKADILELALKK